MKRWAPFSLTVLLILVAWGAFMHVLGRWDQAESSRVAEYERSVKLALKTGNAWRAEQDSMAQLELAHKTRADSLEPLVNHRGTVVMALLDSLRISLALVEIERLRPDPRSLVDEIVAVYEAELEARDELVSELRAAILLADQRAERAEARVLQLEDLLEEGLEIRSCHIDPFGILPCPSRGVVFVAGAVIGVTVTLVAAT